MNIETVRSSWTYNHKHTIVTLSLVVALIVQVFNIHLPANNTVLYVAQCNTLDCIIDRDTEQYLKDNMWYYRADARTEVLNMNANKIVQELMQDPDLYD